MRPPTGPSGSLTREAPRLGRLVWASEGIAAALGEVLASGAADDEQVVELARRINAHVSAAGVLRARLPELREFPVASLVRGDGLDRWAALLEQVRGADPAMALELEQQGAAVLAAGCRRVVADASPVGSPTVRRHLARLGEQSRGTVDEALLAELAGP